MAGDADTLREYWSGHGHAGPSHGAERDAIRWGSPGDFDRCVAQVTEHGKMTPDEAKGYCNLRHHDALGYYPAQHAKMEEGKTLTEVLDKAYPGSQEARVPPGSATGGQWTVGADGPSTAPQKPNPYGKKGKKGKGKKGGKKGPPGKPGMTAHQRHLNHQKQQAARADAAGDKAAVAQIRAKIADLQSQLKALQAKLATKGPTTKPGTKTGTKKPAGTAASTTTTKPTSATTASGKPKKASTSSSSKASIKAQIAQIKAQIAQLQQEAIQAAKWVEPDLTKNLRNPRDLPSGKFRTFEGEAREAQHAHAEGRISDAVEYLGSARALAPEGHARFILGSLQGALARTQHVAVPAVMKYRYRHGWIPLSGGDVSSERAKLADDTADKKFNDLTYKEHEAHAQVALQRGDKTARNRHVAAMTTIGHPTDDYSARGAIREAERGGPSKVSDTLRSVGKPARYGEKTPHQLHAPKAGDHETPGFHTPIEQSHLSQRNRDAISAYDNARAAGVQTEAPGHRDTTGMSSYQQFQLEHPTPGVTPDTIARDNAPPPPTRGQRESIMTQRMGVSPDNMGGAGTAMKPGSAEERHLLDLYNQGLRPGDPGWPEAGSQPGWTKMGFGDGATTNRDAHAAKNNQTGRTVMYNGDPVRVGEHLGGGKGKQESYYSVYHAETGQHIGMASGTVLARQDSIEPSDPSLSAAQRYWDSPPANAAPLDPNWNSPSEQPYRRGA